MTETYQRVSELMIEVAGPDGSNIEPLQVGIIGVDVLASFLQSPPDDELRRYE